MPSLWNDIGFRFTHQLFACEIVIVPDFLGIWLWSVIIHPVHSGYFTDFLSRSISHEFDLIESSGIYSIGLWKFLLLFYSFNGFFSGCFNSHNLFGSFFEKCLHQIISTFHALVIGFQHMCLRHKGHCLKQSSITAAVPRCIIKSSPVSFRISSFKTYIRNQVPVFLFHSFVQGRLKNIM